MPFNKISTVSGYSINFCEISNDGKYVMCFAESDNQYYLLYSTDFDTDKKFTIYGSEDNGTRNKICNDHKVRQTQKYFSNNEDALYVFFITDEDSSSTLNTIRGYKLNSTGIEKEINKKIYVTDLQDKYDNISDTTVEKYEFYSFSLQGEYYIVVGAAGCLMMMEFDNIEDEDFSYYLTTGYKEDYNIYAVTLFNDTEGVFVRNGKLYYYYKRGEVYKYTVVSSDYISDSFSKLSGSINSNDYFIFNATKSDGKKCIVKGILTTKDEGDSYYSASLETIDMIEYSWGWNVKNINCNSDELISGASETGIFFTYKENGTMQECADKKYSALKWCSSSNKNNNSITLIACDGTDQLYYLNRNAEYEDTFEQDDDTFANDKDGINLIETSIDGNYYIAAGRYDHSKNYIYAYNGSNAEKIDIPANDDHGLRASTSFTSTGGNLYAYFINDYGDASYFYYYIMTSSGLKINKNSGSKGYDTIQYEISTGIKDSYYAIDISKNGSQMVIGCKSYLIVIEAKNSKIIRVEDINDIIICKSEKHDSFDIRSVACSNLASRRGIFIDDNQIKTYYYEGGDVKLVKFNDTGITCYKISNLFTVSSTEERFYCVVKNSDGTYRTNLGSIYYNSDYTAVSVSLITNSNAYKHYYNWDYNNLRTVGSKNFVFSSTTGLCFFDNKNSNFNEYECAKYGVNMKWGATSFNLNNDIYMYAVDGTNAIYKYISEYTTTTTTTTNARTTMENSTIVPNNSLQSMQIEDEETEQEKLLKIRILRKAKKLLKKIKCNKKFIKLQKKLSKNPSYKYFYLIVRKFIKYLNKIKILFKYNTGFSLKLWLNGNTGKEIFICKIIQFKNNKGFISHKNLNTYFDNFMNGSENPNNKNKINMDCSLFY